MNLAFQRKLDRHAGSFICRILSLIHQKPGTNVNPVKVDKVLIILLSEMGSLVLAYPMFQRLKEKYRDAEIYALVFQKNREALEIMDIMPRENILTICDDSLMTFVKDIFIIVRNIREIKFDAVIDCELFARIGSILSFMSGAGIRVGFDPYTQEGLYRGNFINSPVLYNPYQHISKQFTTLVEAIESNSLPKAKQMSTDVNFTIPPVKLDENEILKMRQRLYGDFPDVADKKLVLVSPGAGILPIRAWPLDYYCLLSKALIETGYAVGIIGLESDKQLAYEILSCCGSSCCIDLTGYTKSIRELLLLFELSSLLIANDGGHSQLSALTRISSIIFFGPETPVLYGPLNEQASVLFASVTCSPCLTAYNHRNSACDGNNLCLKCIQPDQVLTRALEMLGVRETNMKAHAIDLS